MSGVYSVEDLLKLRASPLICKPPNLPPIEEWMGSQEPAAKRPTTRGRAEDSHLQTEGFQKRPTLDPSSRRSTTDPERIVLGPPRRSFASSNARHAGKAGSVEPEDTQKDGTIRHERNKTGEELDHKFADRKGGHFGSVNGRYGGRHDQDHDRPRRRHDDDDSETRPKKDYDRPRWGREDKAIEEVEETFGVKTGSKRDPQPRSRVEQSWLRSDRGTEEARRDNDRSGWRRDRVRDGDWDLPGKNDADPEWMNAPDKVETTQAHTQEEFQQWKERMKAAAAAAAGDAPVEEKRGPSTTVVAPVDDGKSGQGNSLTSLMSPGSNVDSMDKFFAKFGEKRSAVEDKGPAIKPATKSKFASLFGPPVEVRSEPVFTQPMPPTPASPAPVSVPHAKSPAPAMDLAGPAPDADQAGFKRILEMLGKRDATPTFEMSKLKSGSEQQFQERQQSPDLVALFKQGQPSRQTPVSQVPPGFERLLESRSPAQGHRRQETPNKDELLLNLLRQADISAKPTQQHQRDYSDQRPPGLFASMSEPTRNEIRQVHEERPDVDRHNPMQQRNNSRPIFDDPAISGYSFQDELGNRQGLPRRPTNGYEDPYLERFRQQGQKPLQPPPGMPRPPGLEQMSRIPQGWIGQPQPQPQPQHQQTRQGPPPGINVAGSMQPSFGASQQGPMSMMPQQGQRPPQRKYTGESAPPNFPPGIGPPPGFMNNGPPPGFHHNGAASQAQNYSRYTLGGESQGPQQQGPPSIMYMYGNTERRDQRGGNGGVPLPPGFR